MAVLLKVVEKIVGNPDQVVSQLKLVSQRIIASDIVAQHVTSEAALEKSRRQKANDGHERASSFLVGIISHPLEKALNTGRKKSAKTSTINPKQELSAALAAIQDHQVIMLFDDRQIDDLSTELTVTDNSEVVFLRLVPLIGG